MKDFDFLGLVDAQDTIHGSRMLLGNAIQVYFRFGTHMRTCNVCMTTFITNEPAQFGTILEMDLARAVIAIKLSKALESCEIKILKLRSQHMLSVWTQLFETNTHKQQIYMCIMYT